MLKVLRGRTAAGLMAFAIVLANVMVPAIPVFAKDKVPGNNGTLQVHEKGSPSYERSNQPKVCIFNFEGFSLDPNQSGDITIETQGGGQKSEVVGTINLQTDSDGNGATAYINDVGSSLSLENGLYKATLDKKFGTDADKKAKSKVFRVRCNEAPIKDASASIKTSKATCDSSSVAEIVSLANATLTSNGGELDQTVGKHTAVFTAVSGHVFANGKSTLKIKYTIKVQLSGEQCEGEAKQVTPESPELYDFCYSDEDYIWVPGTEGVIYRVNGTAAQGFVDYEGIDLVVTAEADEGYELVEGAQTSWLFGADDFTNEQCLTMTKSATVATDINKDNRISIGDMITWEITVANTSGKEYEAFEIVVSDENAILENDGNIGFLAAGESVTLTATSVITIEHMAACRITNTADLSGWRAMEALRINNQNETEDMPLTTSSATAEYVLDCTPGKGSVKPGTSETLKTPQVAELPYTGASVTPLVAAGVLSLAGIILVAGSAIKSRLLA